MIRPKKDQVGPVGVLIIRLIVLASVWSLLGIIAQNIGLLQTNGTHPLG
jgi:hypothetical protein